MMLPKNKGKNDNRLLIRNNVLEKNGTLSLNYQKKNQLRILYSEKIHLNDEG